ncbi:MAG: GDP-mannose 4,6-dehydratase [Chloroflexi bacterium]|nr:GDP-mannose 4,6-dehydratase [Chloroflexota bacterium]
MRTLITGVTGFVGSHLAENLLNKEGIEVYGIYRWRSRMENLDTLHRAGRLQIIGENSTIINARQLKGLLKEQSRENSLHLIEADILDPFSMNCLMEAVAPDRIFHLAAQSYVPASQNAPAATLTTNIIGQVNLLEAVRKAGIDPQIHIAGSSEEYGLVYPQELPLKETNPLRPLSPYGVSKVAQEKLAIQYFHSHGLKTTVTRAFNHAGPRRGHVYFTAQFAKQIAEIEAGLRSPILYVGDLNSQRDLTDVRDIAQAYWLALDKGKPGEVYNVGSGRAYPVGEILDMMLAMSETKIEVKKDPARFRPSDVTLLQANNTKFCQQTGWQPLIPLKQSLEDELNYWRERTCGQSH